MENSQNAGNGDAQRGSPEQPFFRVTIELRSSPGGAFEDLQEKLSRKANAILDFIRRGVDIRIETGPKDPPEKPERITIE